MRRLFLVVVLVLVVGWIVMRKLSESEESRLAQLRPEVRAAFEGLRAAMSAQGVQLYVVNTRRSAEQQAEKVAAGLSATTDSWHTLGRGIDFTVGIRDPATGKLRSDHKAENVADYRKVFAIAGTFGFRGVPDGSPFKPDGSKAYITNKAGKKIWDVYHLEYSGGMTFAAAAKRDRGVA